MIAKVILPFLLISASVNADEMCSKKQKHPKGKPQGFNINKSLSAIKKLEKIVIATIIGNNNTRQGCVRWNALKPAVFLSAISACLKRRKSKSAL